MNVLLLEDDLALSAVASEQIESRGHTVYPAFDIAQARAIIEDDSIEIDILIADQFVPDGNGTDFAIETKEVAGRIQVVVVSGLLDKADLQKLDAKGVDHYGKPSLYADIVEDLIRKHFPSAN
jgi:CheY-like chemotaxis protein